MLSWDAVQAIRRSKASAVSLARRLGVSDSLIGKVRRGELYKTRDSRRSPEASDRAGWALAFYTGMRRSEIISTVHGRPSPTISASAGLQIRR